MLANDAFGSTQLLTVDARTGALTRQTRVVGTNDIGMVAWHCSLKTPEYADGREIVIIANDVTVQSGSFGVREDDFFKAASEYARAKGMTPNVSFLLLMSKFLWRQGYVRCPEYCSPDAPEAECVCSCPSDIIGDAPMRDAGAARAAQAAAALAAAETQASGTSAAAVRLPLHIRGAENPLRLASVVITAVTLASAGANSSGTHHACGMGMP